MQGHARLLDGQLQDPEPARLGGEVQGVRHQDALRAGQGVERRQPRADAPGQEDALAAARVLAAERRVDADAGAAEAEGQAARTGAEASPQPCGRGRGPCYCGWGQQRLGRRLGDAAGRQQPDGRLGRRPGHVGLLPREDRVDAGHEEDHGGARALGGGDQRDQAD
eukprot:4330994-Alexandrium_andersonii.AAC.1